METDFPENITKEGVEIMEEILRTWASKTSEQDGEDLVMSDDSTPEKQLEELRKCMESFQPQIEKNPWLQSVISSL